MDTPKQRVGIFTGGGVAPGLNAVLSRAAIEIKKNGHEAVGIPDGWDGLLKVRNEDLIDLTGGFSRRELHDLLSKGGTDLGTTRTKINPNMYDQVRKVAGEYGLTGIIAIGGDDTLGQARRLHEAGILKAIGAPKTIDNDLKGTDETFGFSSAVHMTAQVIRRMRNEAVSGKAISIVETMGRDAGWIALHAGEAGGADITLIPEFPVPEDELIRRIDEVYHETNRKGRPARCAVIAISEGYFGADEDAAKDQFGHPKLSGASSKLSAMIKDRMKVETKKHVVGYESRNCDPVASDAIFAGKIGAYAGTLASAGMYGRMVALRDGRITDVSLQEAAGGRFVTAEDYDAENMSMRLVPKQVQQLIRTTRDRLNGDSDTDGSGI